MADIIIREACVEDCEEIFRLSMELFRFENIAHNFKGTISSFRQDGFGNKRRFACIVAEDPNISVADHQSLVGFALYTWLYRTRECGHVMHVEELYITEKYRSKGIGSAIMKKTLQVAATQRCLGVQLVARSFNILALEFYKKIGAVNATETHDWRMIKLYEDKIKEQCERLGKSQSTLQGSEKDGESVITGVSNVYIRDASLEDCDEILRLMKELASYHDEAERFETNAANLLRNGFGEEQHFQCIVAEEKNSTKSGESKLIGYLLYTWIYKAWLGSVVMHIEDVYISEGHRRKGTGTKLVEEAIKATRMKCFSHIQLIVRQKTVVDFFKTFGAVDATEELGMNLMTFGILR